MPPARPRAGAARRRGPEPSGSRRSTTVLRRSPSRRSPGARRGVVGLANGEAPLAERAGEPRTQARRRRRRAAAPSAPAQARRATSGTRRQAASITAVAPSPGIEWMREATAELFGERAREEESEAHALARRLGREERLPARASTSAGMPDTSSRTSSARPPASTEARRARPARVASSALRSRPGAPAPARVRGTNSAGATRPRDARRSAPAARRATARPAARPAGRGPRPPPRPLRPPWIQNVAAALELARISRASSTGLASGSDSRAKRRSSSRRHAMVARGEPSSCAAPAASVASDASRSLRVACSRTPAISASRCSIALVRPRHEIGDEHGRRHERDPHALQMRRHAAAVIVRVGVGGSDSRKSARSRPRQHGEPPGPSRNRARPPRARCRRDRGC